MRSSRTPYLDSTQSTPTTRWRRGRLWASCLPLLALVLASGCDERPTAPEVGYPPRSYADAAPPITSAQVEVGDFFSCALRSDGSIVWRA